MGDEDRVAHPLLSRTLSPAAPGSPAEYLTAAVSVGLVTGVGWIAAPVTGYQAVSLLYLLAVAALGVKLSRGPVLAAAASGALLWNFLFVPPHFTLRIERLHDGMMFATLFFVAIAMGHLTTRLRRSEIAERRRQRRAAALYELAHQAAFSTDLDSGLRAAASLVESIFGARIALSLRRKDHSLSPSPHPAGSLALFEKERQAAEWAFEHRAPAGRGTAVLPDCEALHLPLQGRTAVMGVISLAPPARAPLGADDRELLEAIAVLLGLILEKDHILQALKHAEVLEASDRFRRALLDSVSHELKTPLAAVRAGIDALARAGDSDVRRTAIREVLCALRRLDRVINNLLDMTRIESGVIRPKLEYCDVGELIQAAIDLAGDAVAERPLVVEADKHFPMVRADQALLEQCLCNLLLNAASNSPPASRIALGARIEDGELKLYVRDEGKGIPAGDLRRIFQMFYRGADSPPGGTGLGLAIVEGFVRAHGGRVWAANLRPRGAEFTIAIPVETLKSEEVERLP